MSASVFKKFPGRKRRFPYDLKQQGSYYLLPMMGLWVKAEAGGLWSGPYTTTDGVVFTLVGGAGAGITWDSGATWDAGTLWV